MEAIVASLTVRQINPLFLNHLLMTSTILINKFLLQKRFVTKVDPLA